MTQGWKLKLLSSDVSYEDANFVATNFSGKLVQTIGRFVENEMRLNFWEGIFVIEGGRGEPLDKHTEEMVRKAVIRKNLFNLFPFYRLRSLGYVLHNENGESRFSFPDKGFKKSNNSSKTLKFISLNEFLVDGQNSSADVELPQYICVGEDIQSLFFSVRNISSFL